MSTIIENFNNINSNIKKLNPDKKVNIVAISKTFPIEHIKPLIDYGHLHFGENKVQEATAKWLNIKNNNNKIKLHMVGKLQSNKAKDAAEIFRYNTKLRLNEMKFSKFQGCAERKKTGNIIPIHHFSRGSFYQPAADRIIKAIKAGFCDYL